MAAASTAGAVAPVPGLSMALDIAMIISELRLYQSQFGLPKKGSREFQRMTHENQEKIQRFCSSNQQEIVSLLGAYVTKGAVEELVRFIPLVGPVIAGGISFTSTYNFLKEVLKKLKQTALDVLKEMHVRALDDAS